jgi:hypothetical protein
MKAGGAKYLLGIAYGLSLGAGIAILLINVRLAALYLQASGKTRALFALVADLSFGPKYFLLFPVLGALVLAAVVLFAKPGPAKGLALGAILLALLNLAALWQGWRWLVYLQ